MDKTTYNKTIFDIEYELNQKGKQGFELVSVIHEEYDKVFYLKRRRRH